jgi:hypothetical protein
MRLAAVAGWLESAGSGIRLDLRPCERGYDVKYRAYLINSPSEPDMVNAQILNSLRQKIVSLFTISRNDWFNKAELLGEVERRGFFAITLKATQIILRRDHYSLSYP